jgi:hypothetical protein
VLLFEFFPAFVALVSVIVGVMLWRANTRAQAGPNPEPLRKPTPAPNADKADATERGAGRPSFRA